MQRCVECHGQAMDRPCPHRTHLQRALLQPLLLLPLAEGLQGVASVGS